MDSLFASSDRASINKLRDDKNAIESIAQFKELLNALPYVAAILNDHRQIIYSNEVMLETLGVVSIDDILGLKPGEALSCVNSFNDTGGCGTSDFCRVCGAVSAILESQKTKRKVVEESRITSKIKDEEISADYLVSATPFYWNNEHFTILTLNDISHEKRRRILEKIFFHDIVNKAGSLTGFLDLLKDVKEIKKIKEYLNLAGS